MPVQLIKVQPNPATAQRIAEVNTALTEAFRSVAPAARNACEDMGRAFEQLRTQRPA